MSSTGIGFESHYTAWNYPGRVNITRSMNLFAALGLRIRFTEIDVQTRDFAGPRAAKLQQQAFIYADLVDICMRHSACDGVTFWGFSDAYTWIPQLTHNTTDEPLMFDATFVPKPSYYSTLCILSSNSSTRKMVSDCY